MSDDEVIANYLEARAFRPMLCGDATHGKWKLALKDELARRELQLPEDASRKVVGAKPTPKERHQRIIATHGRRFGEYHGPKGHVVLAVEIDETVLVEDTSPKTIAEVVELAPSETAVSRRGVDAEVQRQIAAVG